jgi:hypothetical protein
VTRQPTRARTFGVKFSILDWQLDRWTGISASQLYRMQCRGHSKKAACLAAFFAARAAPATIISKERARTRIIGPVTLAQDAPLVCSSMAASAAVLSYGTDAMASTRAAGANGLTLQRSEKSRRRKGYFVGRPRLDQQPRQMFNCLSS